MNNTNIARTLNLAFELHASQVRKCSNSPYITHILDVTRILMNEPGSSENLIIAGILHDTLEDTSYTRNELLADFGLEVLELVLFATEPKNHTDTIDSKVESWKERKQHTIDKCQTATEEQLTLILADKLANLNSMKEELYLYGDSFWSHFNASKEDIYWYYENLHTIFSERLADSSTSKLFNSNFSKGRLKITNPNQNL